MFLKILVLIASYFIGAIPSAYILGKKIGKINIMEHGSGNVGTTNTFRILGWKIGSLVFIADMAKGFVSAYFGFLAGGSTLAIICGVLAVIGHTFSVFIGFKGGKGVATGAGVVLFMEPLALVFVVIIWGLVAFFSGYISLASIVAAVSAIIFMFIFSSEPVVIIMVILVCGYIILKHRSNIKRLMDGTENKIRWKEKVFKN